MACCPGFCNPSCSFAGDPEFRSFLANNKSRFSPMCGRVLPFPHATGLNRPYVPSWVVANGNYRRESVSCHPQTEIRQEVPASFFLPNRALVFYNFPSLAYSPDRVLVSDSFKPTPCKCLINIILKLYFKTCLFSTKLRKTL